MTEGLFVPQISWQLEGQGEGVLAATLVFLPTYAVPPGGE